ncbi:MAG: endolytic transglycosylase MltG [Balneolales bacterium]
MINPLQILSKRELLFGAVAFLIAFILVYSVRSHLINSPDAISSDATEVLLLHEAITLVELPAKLDSLDVTYNEENLHWVGEQLNWKTLREGRYEIRGGSSNKAFLERLVQGMQDPLNVLIPSGTTKDRFVQRVSRQMRFDDKMLLGAMKDSTTLAKLEVKDLNLMGRMLPNTYQMFWTSTPEQFLERMISEFEKKVITPHQDRFKELDRNVDEIVTMASIIEWESNLEEEKPVVGGLYWNRLNQNWRLQADPTINYALGERSRLRYSDYRIDHPYNTYRINGLPPGPITNPSYSSIDAALHPDDHEYMFMVASPEGGHVFTKTFDEHRQKSREWTSWLQEQQKIKEKKEAEAALEAESS